MLSKLKRHLTYANVMVTLLAFVVLGGGAYAASKIPKNSVGSKQLKKHAVTPSKIASATIKRFKGQKGDTGPQGPAGAAGPRGPEAASHGFQASGGTGANSVSASLFGTTVVTVAVPPYNYLVTSTVEADTADGNSGSILCRLINEGGTGSIPTTRSQDIAATGPAENFTLVGEFAISAGQSMKLECSRSGASSLLRVDSANIVAVQISDFTGVPD
jgi:hypothetical protein